MWLFWIKSRQFLPPTTLHRCISYPEPTISPPYAFSVPFPKSEIISLPILLCWSTLFCVCWCGHHPLGDLTVNPSRKHFLQSLRLKKMHHLRKGLDVLVTELPKGRRGQWALQETLCKESRNVQQKNSSSQLLCQNSLTCTPWAVKDNGKCSFYLMCSFGLLDPVGVLWKKNKFGAQVSKGLGFHYLTIKPWNRKQRILNGNNII